ncbi:hypothetical protein [Paenibacillus elgii]|nr:hypothetical protein [Paenibacillus elgii]
MKNFLLSIMMGLILLSGIIPVQPTQPVQPAQPTQSTNMSALDDHGWGG